MKFSDYSKVQSALQVFLILAAFAAIWQFSVSLFHVPEYLLPSVTDLIREFRSDWTFYLQNALYTLETTALAFVVASIIGVALAIAVVSAKLVDNVIMTLLAAFHNVPKVALAPLFVIWLGTGQLPKVAIGAMIAVFTIVVDTVVGLKSADPEVINFARTKKARPLTILTKVRLPGALPNLFGALKTATSFALIGAVVGEFVGGEQGLGYIIMTAQGSFDTTRAFVAIVLLGLCGTALYYCVDFLESIFLPWHVAHRRT